MFKVLIECHGSNSVRSCIVYQAFWLEQAFIAIYPSPTHIVFYAFLSTNIAVLTPVTGRIAVHSPGRLGNESLNMVLCHQWKHRHEEYLQECVTACNVTVSHGEHVKCAQCDERPYLSGMTNIQALYAHPCLLPFSSSKPF
ncbi:hypothetical protein VCUG_01235 [Vavraia culicis subsp. floridensis]|uniref:Uncharacterized protein n=1 Tax=Vavraia culicis (isolate floridensis) TaxID=948595 RepID=L2GUC3_VAVCU|nr:uncharacterized protein VCUG_01235 [Vavraia culicis subsp. floridensis]ELA47239.1 hypothetical protein VCUG_01235 [Vavraia culicis subsp. floridensis]